MAYLQRHRDGLVALLLAVAVCLMTVLVCGTNHVWGDDYAAYILEGQAIANGTLDQQIRDNVMLHPTDFFSANLQETTELVYVWGYPLVLSAVFRLFGGTASMQELFFLYKLLNCAAIGAIAGVAYLFYAKRFRRMTAVILTCMLVNVFFSEANGIHSDVFFTCFCLICYYLYERWQERGNPVFCGIVLGLCMWYVYVLRLNGFAIILWLVLRHIWTMFRRKWSWKDLVPFAVYFVLWGAGRLLMPVPTSNMGDFFSRGNIPALLWHYIMHFGNWIVHMVPHGNLAVCAVFSAGVVACGFWGLVCREHYKREFWNYLLMIGTFLVALTLSYGQGIRYMLYILPLVTLCIGFGAEDLYSRLAAFLKRRGKSTALLTAAAVLICAGMVEADGEMVFEERQKNVTDTTNPCYFAFTEPSIDMYRYISENTPKSAVIAFGKTRTLALATDRLAFIPGFNGHELLTADYFLRDTIGCDFHIEPTEEEYSYMTLVYENDAFQLYAIRKDAP